MAKVVDLKTRSEKYWKDRTESMSARLYKQADKDLPKINKLYKSASSKINDRVQADFVKYGVMKESPVFKTLADGTKVISGTSSKLILPEKAMNVKLVKGTRLNKLQIDIYDILKDTTKTQAELMTATLSRIAESAYYESIYEVYKGYSVGTSFSVLSKAQIMSMIKNPVNGENFSKRIWTNRDLLANQVNQVLKAGLTQGISNGEMATRISKKMGSGYKVAARLVNTEVTNSLNQGTKLGYEQSGIVQKYKYLATLDSRTSDICQDLDGKVFDLKDASTGLNYPPMHVNCRSTTTAYFDNSTDGLTRIARDMGGNTFLVPGDMTYKEFAKEHIK